MPKFAFHILVCTHQRPDGNPRGCCADKGSEQVLMKFKEVLAARRPEGVVRANKSGCMNQCGRGTTVVVYPEAVWYGGVTSGDVEEIVASHLMEGAVVERLVIPEEILNTPAALGNG